MKLLKWDIGKIFAGVVTSILVAILGFLVTLFVFFIEGRDTDEDHEVAIIELKEEIKGFRVDIKDWIRIASELRYELFTYKQQKRGIEQDSTEMIIDLNR